MTLAPLAAMVWLAPVGSAQITSLCNTGQTGKTASGCTGVLVPPNLPGGGSNRDGNWFLAYPYPTPYTGVQGPCTLQTFEHAWVDSLASGWLPNSVSTVSEWITPYDGENIQPAGWYVYATSFPVPAMLPGGAAPTGVIINGQLASDNPTWTIYLESPAHSANCTLVAGQLFPVNPAGGHHISQSLDYSQWWPFSFTNKLAITPGTDAYLYFVVQNWYDPGLPNGESPIGFRAEFFSTSTFTTN